MVWEDESAGGKMISKMGRQTSGLNAEMNFRNGGTPRSLWQDLAIKFLADPDLGHSKFVARFQPSGGDPARAIPVVRR